MTKKILSLFSFKKILEEPGDQTCVRIEIAEKRVTGVITLFRMKAKKKKKKKKRSNKKNKIKVTE